MTALTLKPPTSATVDMDTGCSRLWFESDSLAPSGFYQVAGGICWPMLVHDVFKGHVVLAARHVDTETVYVFDHREFSSIEHVISPDADGGIQVPGLAPWFVRNWATYYAYRYYWFQLGDYHKTFRLRIHRCELINPKPSLIETHWSSDDHAQLLIADILEQRKLKLKAGQILDELEQQQADPDAGPFPAVHALACVLSGLGTKRIPEKSVLIKTV